MHARFADVVTADARPSTGGRRQRRTANVDGNAAGADPARAFATFATAAIKGAGLPSGRVDEAELAAFAEEQCGRDFLSAARRTAAYLALRAAIGPLLESIVLCDQLIFLQEHGSCAEVRAVPVFEPSRSPRNIAIVALKRVQDTGRKQADT